MSSGWGKNSSVFRRFRHNYTDEISPNLPGSKLCPKLDTENASLYLQGRNKITPPILNYSGIWHDILPKINSNTSWENKALVKSLFDKFSQKDVFLYFHEFYLRSFKTEKEVKFLPPSKLEKIVRPRVKFLSLNWHLSPTRHFPQLALPQLAPFAIFLVPLRIWVPQLPVQLAKVGKNNIHLRWSSIVELLNF